MGGLLFFGVLVGFVGLDVVLICLCCCLFRFCCLICF